MKSELLHRAAQLLVVIGGFYTGLAVLPWNTCNGWQQAIRLVATALFILGLTVRYWWVILLLDWPFRVIRVALLLAVWMEVVIAAQCVAESRVWVLVLAAVSWTGALTEGYNLATGQWRHPKASLTATLFRDHVAGAIAASAGGAGLLGIAIVAATDVQPWLVLVLALLDWGRLVEMIGRHQRLLRSDGNESGPLGPSIKPGIVKRHYRKLPADECVAGPSGPSFSRGWIRICRPWRHPLAVLQFLRMWRQLKRELDRSPGLIAFEYRVRLSPLTLGMHIVWQSHEDEMRFYRDSSHRAISNWSFKSPLTPAVRLEHFLKIEPNRRARLGGFYLYEQEGDLPEEIH